MRDRLAGRSVLVTGGSGFLGKAVLAALLRHGDGIERLLVLLRARSDAAARQRLLEEVLVAEPFADLPAAEIRERLDAGGSRPSPAT